MNEAASSPALAPSSAHHRRDCAIVSPLDLPTLNDLPLADAWRTLAHLLGRLRSIGHRSDWLVETLDLLVEQLEADRGLVFVRDPGADRVVEARDRRGSLPQHERWAVSQSVIQRAIEDGRPCYWELGSDDATESLASFGIIAAVALPLL